MSIILYIPRTRTYDTIGGQSMDGKERGYDCWAKQDFMEGELEIGMGLERGSECPNGIDIQQKNCEGFRGGEKSRPIGEEW